MLRLLLGIHSEVEKIVYWMPEILFAAEIALCGLDRCVPQQKLNLLQLTAARVAQLGTGSAQVMRGDVLQARPFAATLDYVQHDIL